MHDSIAISDENLSNIEDLELSARLPEKKNIFYQIWCHPFLMPYNLLALMVLAVNLTLFVRLDLTPMIILNLVLANFSLAIIIRSQRVVNLLFKLATMVPKSWPISIRRHAGKIYHFGGLHVGSYFGGTLWFLFLAYTIAATNNPIYAHSFKPLLPLFFFHLAVLGTVIIFALPRIRATYHNQFEIVARFGNWLSLLLFWAQTILLVNPTPNNSSWALALVSTPQIWVLCALTFIIALPWLRLKKVPVEIETPSNHVALARFNYGTNPFAGSSTDLSLNPLFEWHPFANIIDSSKEGFRLAISRAGDWTGRVIEQKPTHLWTKGIHTAGVGHIELIFKKVIWVATGSGVGPCVPHLLSQQVPSLLVWSTRNPAGTYGETFINDIAAVQPNAVIWNTTEQGKPDLVQLSYDAYRSFGAEAVIIIANKKATWNVVYELESRGIPAYGAIWDS